MLRPELGVLHLKRNYPENPSCCSCQERGFATDRFVLKEL